MNDFALPINNALSFYHGIPRKVANRLLCNQHLTAAAITMILRAVNGTIPSTAHDFFPIKLAPSTSGLTICREE